MQVQVTKQAVENELGKEILETSENNPALARMVIESIAQELSQGNKAQSDAIRQQSAKTDHLYNLQKKRIGLNTVREESEDKQEDYENYQQDKKDSKDEFKVITKTIDKFKILGYNSKGWPIYRVTDIYYASDPYTQKLYEDKIQMLTKNDRPRKVKEYKEDSYSQIIERWKNRENDQFNDQDKDEMDEQELKEIVADMGQKRQNFFLYYKDFNQATEKYFQPLNMQYSPLNSCDFIQNFNKAVFRKKQQYVNIQEFDGEKKAVLQDFDPVEASKSKLVYWGEGQKSGNNFLPIKTSLFTIQDELLQLTTNVAPTTLTNAILKQHSYINSEVVEEKYKLPLQELQRIQIDLSNPNFFLKKVNLSVAKRSQQLYSKALDFNKTKINTVTGEDNKNRLEQSVISQSSRHTGGPTISLKPISDSVMVMQPTGLQSFDNLIFEKAKIQSQKKSGIKHSEIANRLTFTKFKLNPKDFVNFHRYNYPWGKHNNIQLTVNLVKSKPSRSKGQFLQLNTQKQQSYVKFSTFSSLSLASGDFIAVQNIQESPLIMSNIGMCTKMYLQVNPKPIIDRMHTDIYKQRQFQQLEEARDKMHLNKQSLPENCASWRKIIGESLGSNGKLYLGTQNSSLLIGSPEGVGVAVMESNLAAVPVVKQKNNPCDFILVREGGNWYLRRIDNIYTSGQIEPKMQVFPPDSRNITNFMGNYFKAYAKKRFQQSSNVPIEQFKILFNFNEHNIRRSLKQINARTKDSKHYMGSEDKDVDFDVTPEQICQYQKMQHNLYNLQVLGITNLKTPDKLKQTITTFFKKYPDDLTKFALSKLISDELHLASWYLSEAFLNAEQGQSKIQLVGLGDPTNGHGGYSYIKKPQKQRVQKQQQIDKRVDKKVSGTAFDLRKLRTQEIDKLLVERGKRPQQFAGMGRWPKINMLKKIGGDQYERPQRHDKKKKKQTQKRQVSAIFNKMLKNISAQVQIQEVNTNQPDTVNLDYYIKRQRPNWQVRRDKLFNQSKGDSLIGNMEEEDGDDDNDQNDEE